MLLDNSLSKKVLIEEEEKVVRSKDELDGPPTMLKRSKPNESSKEIQNAINIEDVKTFELGDGRFDKSEIKISSWNINGVRAALKRGELQKYIRDADLDIICLNETKIDDQNFRKENVKNEFPAIYHHYWSHCSVRSGYSGVAVLSKVAPISARFTIGIPKLDQEGRLVTLEYEKFFLVACYVPNSGLSLERLSYRTNEWDPELRAYLCKLRDIKHVVLCGDLNLAYQEIDLLDPRKESIKEKRPGYTQQERGQFKMLLEEGFVDSFRHFYPDKKQYTYWTARFGNRKENKGLRGDYFIVDKKGMDLVVDSRINDAVLGSDHCPIELIFRP